MSEETATEMSVSEETPTNPEAEPTEGETEAPKQKSPELEKYWKAVKDNPSDFTGWTYLLQYVEQTDDVDEARTAFDAFMDKYPYCYGYWKKYADFEQKHGNIDQVQEVFQRGVEAIHLSIDLWVHFINFTTQRCENDPHKEAKIRRVYEQAVEAAGEDFRCNKLWEMYIGWETENKQLKNVTALFDRVLAIPTQLCSQHFEKFKEHVKSSSPRDIISLDEFLKLRQELVKDKEPKREEDECDPPGIEEAPPGLAGKEEEEETEQIRQKIIEMRQKVYDKTEEEIKKRSAFEEAIRRPYFHVKPLEKGQLKNWREYIDFELEQGSHKRIVVLFERCLVACALYEEFWNKFAKYLESHSLEETRAIFKRACHIHLPKKPSVHFAWAAFEEKHGNYDAATEVLENLESNVPGLASVKLRRIGLLRRQSQSNEVEQQFADLIEKASDAAHHSFYSIKFARYLAKVVNDHERAHKILLAALEKDQNNHKIYLQLVDLEYQRSDLSEGRLIEVFNLAIKSGLDLGQRVAFSQRKLEFLEDFSCTVDKLTETYDEHQNLLREVQNNKKRKADDSEADKGNVEKKAKTDNHSQSNGGSGDQNYSHYQDQSHHQGDYNMGYNYGGWGGYNYNYPSWGHYNYGYHGGS